MLAQFTEEGIRILKNSLQWAGQGDLGCVIEEICWTPGQYDIVAIVDAKDDQALTTFGLAWGSAGNVRSKRCEPSTRANSARLLEAALIGGPSTA
ncbi:MAG TPA: GYD domain-containing protein [Paraburkholderia sp.]|uniref:GYD domain-containing protein n=1 Tax=Paraburkholderia sp. TaxID=1926495 RepID=UPI002C260596|nr:GYD domain-containing protein [Paraburkholderia sp.]HTR07778.1 GYD domain-containing protein [Paraburkholderia sp.]